MKNLFMLIACVCLVTLVGCNKDKVKAKAARVMSAAAAPAVSSGLKCETGVHTYAFLEEKLYEKIDVDRDNLKSLAKDHRKGVFKNICVAALLKLKEEFVEWADGGLSDEMIADGCSAENLSGVGVDFLASRCPG